MSDEQDEQKQGPKDKPRFSSDQLEWARYFIQFWAKNGLTAQQATFLAYEILLLFTHQMNELGIPPEGFP